MERVSPTSAALLRLESANGHQHAGWLARLDAQDGPLDIAALRIAVDARLTRAPRLRHVPIRPDAGADGLFWREATGFDVADHVVAGPDGVLREEEVRDAVDGFLAEELPRERPLWRVLVLPRTRLGGSVIVGKVHRALADGHDRSLLRELIFDPASEAADERAAADRLALDELREARRVEALGEGGVRIGATLRRVALSRTVGPLVEAPPSCFDGQARGRTTLVTARVELGRLTRISEHTGATVHDVVLAIAAGALRRLAIAGGDVQPTDVRALVPVELGAQTVLGDTPCAVIDLPVGERSAARRLAAVQRTMDAAAGHRVEPALEADERPPTVLAGPPEELATRLALGARVCNVTIPSAHGPERGRRIVGARIRALYPVAPVMEDHALALGTLSYARHLHVGAAADTRAIAAIGRLPVMLVDAVEELGVSTGTRGSMAAMARRGERPRLRG